MCFPFSVNESHVSRTLWEHAGVRYIILHCKTASPYSDWSHFMDTWISICQVKMYLKLTYD